MPRGRSGVTGNASDPNRGRNNQGFLEVERASFSSGASRDAYRCRVRNGCVNGFTEGTYCIVKRFKAGYRHLEISHTDVNMQQYARELAMQFTEECSPRKKGSACPILIRDADLAYVQQFGCNALLEREIKGSFQKFNSNSGWTLGQDPILDAFSHWMWHVTREEILVCDLQGHRGSPGSENLSGQRQFYYFLTDPAINSRSKSYGINDMGQNGIVAFFNNHVCNQICKQLGLHGHRPKRDLSVSIPVQRSTSYSPLDFQPQHSVPFISSLGGIGEFSDDDSSYDDDYDYDPDYDPYGDSWSHCS